MSKAYIDRPDDIAADAKAFSASEYGKYRMEILDSMMSAALGDASRPNEPYPDRYLARYRAFKELKESIESDLGIDTPAVTE